MRVLLLKTVANLGPRGGIVNVARGYARNFLVPRNLAMPATEGTEDFARRVRRTEEKRRVEEQARLGELAERLSAASCSLTRRAGEDEKLFGSVSTTDIAQALNNQGFSVEKHQVKLAEPIKTLGVYTVPVQLSSEHGANVKVWVVRENS